jgi:hypothetical protein
MHQIVLETVVAVEAGSGTSVEKVLKCFPYNSQRREENGSCLVPGGPDSDLWMMENRKKGEGGAFWCVFGWAHQGPRGISFANLDGVSSAASTSRFQPGDGGTSSGSYNGDLVQMMRDNRGRGTSIEMVQRVPR